MGRPRPSGDRDLPGGGGGGGQRPNKKSLRTEDRPPISGPLINFFLFAEDKFSDVGGWGGGGGHRPGGRGSLHFHCFHHIPELKMIYGRSRGLCLARASGCIPLHCSCTLVGVPPAGCLRPPAGCLRAALFVTERYLWSFRPLTSRFLSALLC